MKKVFYYTDVLPFLSKQKAAITKLRSNLDTFKEASGDIQLIWHPWSRTEEFMKLNKCSVIDEYRKIVDEFKAAGWGVLDETTTIADAREVMMSCDAYYGDACDLAFEAKNKGIPVMLQNVDVVNN